MYQRLKVVPYKSLPISPEIMKTKNPGVYPIAIICLLLIFTSGCEKDVDYEGGRGTPDDPYLIATPEQLDGVRHNMDKHFKQIADIDLSGYSSGEGWQPIGKGYSTKGFTGTYDGNGYKIKNLTINRPRRSDDHKLHDVGLFGYTDGSTIKNVGLVNIKITRVLHLGSLVGYNRGNIINCYASGDFSGSGTPLGALVGTNEGEIRNCHASVDVIGDWQVGVHDGYGDSEVGGLVGLNHKHGNIIDSYATGDVSGKSLVGGLVGTNLGQVKSSYATGDVSGMHGVGGLIGRMGTGVLELRYGYINDSYASGSISGNKYVGGLIGILEYGYTKNSFAVVSVSGNAKTGGLLGDFSEHSISYHGDIDYSYYDKETTGQDDTGKGIPKTTTEMMHQSTFESWDFTDIWRINEGNSYPYLKWQE